MAPKDSRKPTNGEHKEASHEIVPSESSQAPKATKKDGDDKAAERYEETRTFVRTSALLQLCYITYRTFWHMGIPWLLGVQEFVPLVREVFVAELLVVFIFYVGGGFGPANKERGWALNAYSPLAMLVLAKCVLDVYILNFTPTQWRHYNPNSIWGVPELLGASLPKRWPALGLQPATVAKAADMFEKAVDLICILSCFRGVRAGKAMTMQRRALRRALKQKKDD